MSTALGNDADAVKSKPLAQFAQTTHAANSNRNRNSNANRICGVRYKKYP